MPALQQTKVIYKLEYGLYWPEAVAGDETSVVSTTLPTNPTDVLAAAEY